MTDSKNKGRKGVLYVALSAALFALAGILIKLNSWSSISINGARCFFAFFVMLIYLKLSGHRIVVNKTVLVCAVTSFLVNLLFVIANKMTTAANAIVLQFTMPGFLILLLWLFWKKRPDRVSVLCCAASFIGVLFFFMESLSISGSGTAMLGNILAVLSGLLYAVVFLMKKIPSEDFESSMLFSYVISFTVSIPFLAAEESLGGSNLLIAVILGVFQVGFAYIFLAKGLDCVSPVSASLISMLEPVLNPVLVAIFYGETIGMLSLVGAVIVLGSAAYYNIHSIRTEEAE